MWAAVRHVGTTGAPAYVDDLQLVTDGPGATMYDVEWATDSAFTNVIESRSGIEAPSAGARTLTVEGLSRATAYHGRVRGTNAGGTGTWTTGAFTTTDRAPRRYYVKDHLGSIRATLDPDAPGTGAQKVVETRDYYPFGLRMPGRSVTTGTPAVEDYTGHELDVETGMHYAGARYYMSALGRWTSVDPLADEFPAWSGYNYVKNNPLGLLDPDGRAPIDDYLLHRDGKVGHADTNRRDRYFVQTDNNGGQRQLDLSNAEDAAIFRDRVASNGSFRQRLIDNSNTATAEAQTITGQVVVQEGGRQVMADAVGGTGTVTKTLGDGTTAVGGYVALAPGAQPLAASMVKFGKTVSLAGNGLELTGAAIGGRLDPGNVGVAAGSVLADMGLDALIGRTPLSQQANTILQSVSSSTVSGLSNVAHNVENDFDIDR